MKKNLMVLVASILIGAASVQAQDAVKFGFKGGVNLGKMEGKGYNDSFKGGYHLGGFVQLNLTKSIGIQPEVIYSSTNTEVVNATEFETLYDINNIKETKPKLNYLNIPILLNINLGNPRLKLQLGPQYSVMTSQTENVFEEGKRAFKSGAFSGVGGIWIQLPIVNISARYVIGLSDVNNIDLATATNKENWKSQSIQLGIGITL
jgi:hypothetical protein